MMQSNAAHNVPGNFKNSVGTEPFPSWREMSIAQLEALFDGKANRGHISGWRNGTRSIPQWARDFLIAKLTAQRARLTAQIDSDIEELAKEKAPGRKAGARNLAIWRAANPR